MQGWKTMQKLENALLKRKSCRFTPWWKTNLLFWRNMRMRKSKNKSIFCDSRPSSKYIYPSVYECYICMYVYMYVCMHVCKYICMYVCMHVCKCVYLFYVCLHAFKCVSMKILIKEITSLVFAEEHVWILRKVNKISPFWHFRPSWNSTYGKQTNISFNALLRTESCRLRPWW